jgi:hypothetical protein
MSEAEREKLLDLVQTLELKLNSIEQVTQRAERGKNFSHFPLFLFALWSTFFCLVNEERNRFKSFSVFLCIFPLDFTNEEIRRGTVELEAKAGIV